MYQSTYVGLDVHAQTISACALDPATGEIMRTKMSAEPEVVFALLQRFPKDTEVVYEAGPTGYPLARYLRDRSVDCIVAAPSSSRGYWSRFSCRFEGDLGMSGSCQGPRLRLPECAASKAYESGVA